MNLQYVLTFGKFKGSTLEYVAENQTWYLNHIVRVVWLLTGIKESMSEENINYLQGKLDSYIKQRDTKFNNRIVDSYFSRIKKF